MRKETIKTFLHGPGQIFWDAAEGKYYNEGNLYFRNKVNNMVSPDTVKKLKLLKVLVDAHGGHKEIAEFNQIVSAFQENETLTTAEARKANKIYQQLKRFEK